MSRPIVTIIMATTAAVALVALVPAVKSARRYHDIDSSVVLVAVMGLLINLPIAVIAFSGGLSHFVDTLGNTIDVFPGWYHRADDLAKIMVVLICLALTIRQVGDGRVRVHIAALLGIVLWAVAALASGLHGEPVISLSTGTLLACLIAAAVLPRGRGACLGAGFAGVVLAIASGLLAILRHDVGLLPCARKCSVLGSLLTGVLPNANLLGITLAATIPFVYLGFRGRARLWLIFYLLAMVFFTGARVAMAAASITVIVLLLVRPSLDGRRLRWPLKAAPWLLVGGTLAVWVYLANHHWSNGALTDRGLLWGRALHYIHQSPWFGYGPVKWSSLYQISQIPASAQRSAHNQLLDLLFGSGVVGAALLLSMMVATVSSAGRARAAVLVTLGTMMMIGSTEGTWEVGTFDFMSFTLVALILTGDAAGTPDLAAPAGKRRRRGESGWQGPVHEAAWPPGPAGTCRPRGQPALSL